MTERAGYVGPDLQTYGIENLQSLEREYRA